jgi:hypothetical protein
MREGLRAGTRLRQRNKAKATVTHGDDAEAQEPPQHAGANRSDDDVYLVGLSKGRYVFNSLERAGDIKRRLPS